MSLAKNDYYVIVCRILIYLYACLKEGIKPSSEYLRYDSEDFPVGKDYWQYILTHLYTDGYVEGIELVPIMGESIKAVKITEKFAITPKGIEYLEENKPIKKAIGFLKGLKETVPGL